MTTLEMAANAFDAASIWLAAGNRVSTWWTGLVGCALFAALFYRSKLYADVVLKGRPCAACPGLRSYDLMLLCQPDFPFVQDGARRDAAFRQLQYEWYVRELAGRGMACSLIGGHESARLTQALALLGGGS